MHEKLHHAVSSALRKFAHKSYDDQQDLYQEGYLAAWKALPHFHAEAKHLIGYLYYRAYFGMIGYLRTQGQIMAGQDNKRKTPRPAIEDIAEYSIGRESAEHSEAENELMLQWMDRQLSGEMSRYLLRALLHGITNEEVAEQIGRHKDTVGVRKRAILSYFRNPEYRTELRAWQESISDPICSIQKKSIKEGGEA